MSVKRIGWMILTVCCAAPVWASSCSELIGCERKLCEIETQMTLAQQKGLEKKAAGLQIALTEAKAQCTPEKLKRELLAEIEESQQDLVEYQSDLREAELMEKTVKIKKYQAKIEKEELKLQQLTEELASLESSE